MPHWKRGGKLQASHLHAYVSLALLPFLPLHFNPLSTFVAYAGIAAGGLAGIVLVAVVVLVVVPRMTKKDNSPAA